MEQNDTVWPQPTGDAILQPPTQLPIWKLVKQGFALIQQERQNLWRVIGWPLMASLVLGLVMSLLAEKFIAIYVLVIPGLFLQSIILVRWYRFALLGKIPKKTFTEFKSREWHMLGYVILNGLIIALLSSAMAIGLIIITLIGAMLKPAGAVLVLLAIAGFMVGLAYIANMYALLLPHAAVRRLDLLQPLMKPLRKRLLPKIWSFATALGIGWSFIYIPMIILILIGVMVAIFGGMGAVFLSQLNLHGMDPATLQAAGMGTIVTVVMLICLFCSILFMLFQMSITALTYQQMVVETESPADLEPTTGMTPISRLLTKSMAK